MILSNMLWLPKGSLFDINTIKQDLIVKSKFPDIQPIFNYIDTDNYLGVPKNYLPIPKKVKDERIEGNRWKLKFKGTLRGHQKEVVKEWQEFYNKGITEYILNLQTGAGKTVVALWVAAQLKVPFLVIVPRERLLTQWEYHIKKFTNIKDVGFVQQKRCEYEGKKACVGLIHSVCKDRYPDEFKKRFGLIIMDEIHMTPTYTFSQVMKMFPAKYNLALSATLFRQDKMETVFFQHLGRNIISYKEATQPKPRVFIKKYSGNSGKLPYWLNRQDKVKVRACILSNLAKNKERNQLIADFAEILINKGLQTLVIGDRIAQLENIEAILKEKGFDKIGLYISKTKAEQKVWLEKNAGCILATTQMLSVGIDIDTLRGLVYATPHSEVEQIVGRIRRINQNVADPVVVDIWDNYPETIRWGKKRLSYYKDNNFDCQEVT